MKRDSVSYRAYCAGLLTYKPFVTAVNLLGNVLIFAHGTALSYFARQVLNRLDEAFRGRGLGDILTPLAWIVGVSLARVGAIYLCAVLDAVRAYYYQNRTRLGLLRGVFRRGDMTAVAGSSGAIFEALDDDVPAATFPAELLTEAGGYFLCTLGTLAMLTAIRWDVTLLAFLPLSVAIYGVQRLSERMKERRRASRGAHDDVSCFLGDVADSILTIQTSGAQDAVLNAFDRKNKARRQAVLADSAFFAKVEALLSFSIQAGTAIMMCVCAGLMTRGDFRAGDFSLFTASLFVLADCVNRLVELFTEYRKGEVSYERILAAAQEKHLPTDVGLTLKGADVCTGQERPLPPMVLLRVKRLSYTYPGGEGVRDISFQVKPGECVAVAGGVGAGKSTLLQLLSGTLTPDSGEILWDGEAGFPRTPPYCAYSPQKPRFFPQNSGKTCDWEQRGATAYCIGRWRVRRFPARTSARP